MQKISVSKKKILESYPLSGSPPAGAALGSFISSPEDAFLLLGPLELSVSLLLGLLAGFSSSRIEQAIANLLPSELNANEVIEPGYFGNCRSRFFAAESQIDTIPSPPPVANVPNLISG
ncbi:hypothetical protein MJO29_003265 [Puccinia striiformis f. sp. tritici]|nr:hypothetical protein MJO29_003265 [Puccinia striiformis f. sp. tritici]